MTTRITTPLYGGTFTPESGPNTSPDLPFVLPGELITPDPLTILEPSPHRVTPNCVHFTVCGGCHYQHADYPTQLTLKSQILQQILAPIGLQATPTVHSADPYAYRNRIRLRAEQIDGLTHFGYSRRNSNEFLPIRMCPIAAPLLWRAAETLTRLAESEPLITRWLARISELEFFISPNEERLQIQFFLRNAEDANQKGQNFAAFCDRLKAALPELAGASAQMDPELSRRTRRTWPGVTWGTAGLSYAVGERKYWVSRGAFFQVNRFLVETLVQIVTANRSGTLAWDLFAGVGLFARPLSETFQHVVAVEGAEAAAVALSNLSVQTPSLQAVHSPTFDFLRAAVLQRERPDLIVLDPPRAGLGTEGSALLARIAPPEIVYVSCDPVTLARDLAVLLPHYRATAVHLVDLFPQTFHIETVVTLERI
ncbi:class I SAM-dependent RNA methyltransferase [Granulicella tundricola]|uniref:(Uracil-5)-methyltransferase n=1 Tax=Granulicella tundricola (strain ATCC BAA-1859 / DSM 23138 / MP5ACTX9) TaxID=1198114 RepID=E8X3Y8_GRATM|nr:class I SAM-dependent RNA methyltransferase [Granulicella tundricola]ADW70496.1 (Uracil-5)-methyltransferase [Granulicella tundricola MP5ACTX9]